MINAPVTEAPIVEITEVSVFDIKRTSAGRLSLQDASRAGKTGGTRLVRASGEAYLEELGFTEGNQVTEQHLWDMEILDHLYPPVGSVSGRPIEMAGTIFKNPRRVKETLDVTNKRMADKLGKSDLPEGEDEPGKTYIRRLVLDPESKELGFCVYRAATGTFVSYLLLSTAIKPLIARGIKVNDQVDHETQQFLFENGHLYTTAAGRTRIVAPAS